MHTKHDRTLTVFGTAIVTGALLFANADGYHNEWTLHPNASGRFFAEPPTINWTHGWPVCFVIRHGIYSISKGKGVLVMSFGGDHGVYSRWPVDNAPLRHFKPQWLVLDIVTCVLLLAGTAYSLSGIGKRFRWQFRFGVKHLLLLLTVVAVCLALRKQLFPSRFVLQYATFAIIAIGATLSIVACLSVVFRTLRLIRWPNTANATGIESREQHTAAFHDLATEPSIEPKPTAQSN